jgi:general secretion pathway protein G
MRLRRGFTLIELLVVMAVIALLMSIAVPRYFSALDHSKEVALQENLKVLRVTIDKYYADRGHYPDALDELVSQHYLRAVPVDPITESAQTWVTQAAENQKGIADVQSGAQGKTRDGIAYADL